MGVPQAEGEPEVTEKELSVEEQIECAKQNIERMDLSGWGKVLAFGSSSRIAERSLGKLTSVEKPLSAEAKESGMKTAASGIWDAELVARDAHRVDVNSLPDDVKAKYLEALDKSARILRTRDAWREKDPKACQEFVAENARRLYDSEVGLYPTSVRSWATSEESVPLGRFNAFATMEEMTAEAQKLESLLPSIKPKDHRYKGSEPDIAGNYKYYTERVDLQGQAARALGRLKEQIADKAYEEAFIREHSVESQAA